jgi:hypothetical protein
MRQALIGAHWPKQRTGKRQNTTNTETSNQAAGGTKEAKKRGGRALTKLSSKPRASNAFAFSCLELDLPERLIPKKCENASYGNEPHNHKWF